MAPDVVEIALEHALCNQLVSPERLRWRLSELGAPGPAGCGVLRKLLAARDGAARPTESVLETRFLQLLRRAGLPLPVPQYELKVNGTVFARIDFAYPDRLLAVEIDGYRWHGRRAAWRRDLVRQNLLVNLGWRVLRFTWEDIVERPARVVAALREAFCVPLPTDSVGRGTQSGG